jgi:hypothetical protein
MKVDVKTGKKIFSSNQRLLLYSKTREFWGEG